jgi:hypothetical protein
MSTIFFTYVRTPEAQRDHAAAAKARGCSPQALVRRIVALALEQDLVDSILDEAVLHATVLDFSIVNGAVNF